MLWLTGTVCFICWLIAKFLLHKSGMVHLFLLATLMLFVIQFVQDWRTREYRKSLEK